MANSVPEALEHVLFDPQTSGGLLFTVASRQTRDVESRFEAAGLEVWLVGEVTEGDGLEVT